MRQCSTRSGAFLDEAIRLSSRLSRDRCLARLSVRLFCYWYKPYWAALKTLEP